LNRLGLFKHAIGDLDLDWSNDGFTSIAMTTWTKTIMKEYGLMRGSGLIVIADRKLCSDPQDRVFATLSLRAKDFRDKIPVSYKSSTRNLYIEFGKACLGETVEGEPLGGVLSYLSRAADRPRSSELPSWCVNLDERSQVLPFDKYLLAEILKNGDLEHPAKVITSVNSSVIEVEGFEADRIECVLPHDFSWKWRDTAEQVKLIENVIHWNAECRKLFSNLVSDDAPYSHI
jgi:hypothetical protein